MGLALSGGINVWGEFPGDTRSNFISGLTTFLLMAGWNLDSAVAASASGVFASYTEGNFFGAAGITYHFHDSAESGWQANPGWVQPGNLQYLVDAINGNPATKGVKYSNATLPNPLVTASTTMVTNGLKISYKLAGPYGNGISTDVGILKGGGYKATGLSPQFQVVDPSKQLGVQAYVHDTQQQVNDSGGHPSNVANIQFVSKNDSTVVTRLKTMYVGAGVRYRVVANRCQFFCYQPGVAADTRGTVSTGGVPWVASSEGTCSGEVPANAIDEAFYVMNDNGLSATPRTVVGGISAHFTQTGPEFMGVVSDGSHWGSGDGVVNGSVADNPSEDLGAPRIISLTPPWDYVNSPTTLNSTPLWLGEKAMQIEPMVGWGVPTSDNLSSIQGQIWDAWIKTAPSPMDAVDTFDGNHWVAFTNNHKFGTLWLLVPSLTPTQYESLQASYAF